MTGSVVDVVGGLAGSFRVSVSPAQCRLLERFFEVLLTWNRRINLTGARSLEELLADHLPDSFALSCLVPVGASVADVGSGGGLPALPFALLRPDAAVTMFEARAKRQAFLRTAVRELDIRSATVAGRFTPGVPSAGTRFDLASSRATFPPEEWLGLARQIVLPGGHVVVFDTGGPVDSPGARLVAAHEYLTGRGHPRRAAVFAFT